MRPDETNLPKSNEADIARARALLKETALLAKRKLQELREIEPETDCPLLHELMAESLEKFPNSEELQDASFLPVFAAFHSLVGKADMRHLKKGHAEALITIYCYLHALTLPHRSAEKGKKAAKAIRRLFAKAVALARWERKASDLFLEAQQYEDIPHETGDEIHEKWKKAYFKACSMSSEYVNPRKKLLAERGWALGLCDQAFFCWGQPPDFLRPRTRKECQASGEAEKEAEANDIGLDQNNANDPFSF